MAGADGAFLAARAGRGVFADSTDRAGAGTGVIDVVALGKTAPCCKEGVKRALDKSEERLGRAELGTTEGAVAGTPALGNSGSEGTGDGDTDGVGLAGK
jgi:hypothetical protein